MSLEPSPFDGFKAHMLQDVVPLHFPDLSSEDVDLLIKSQWQDMSETERDHWKKRKETPLDSTVATEAPVTLVAEKAIESQEKPAETTNLFSFGGFGGFGSNSFSSTLPVWGSALQPGGSLFKPAPWTPPPPPSYEWGKTYKLLLVGSGGVGKSSWLARVQGENFNPATKVTMGVSVSDVELETTKGKITFRCWDCSGTEEGLGDGYYIAGQAAIIMFSVQDKASYKEADTKYRRGIERVAEKVPMCLVGNKVDQKDRTVKMKEINLHRKIGIEYFEVSVKSGYNLKRPFLSIIRKMFQDPTIMFTEDVPIESAPAAQPAASADTLATQLSSISLGDTPSQSNESQLP